MTFEAIHETSCDSGVNHPNQYFIESQKVLKSKVHAIAIVRNQAVETRRENSHLHLHVYVCSSRHWLLQLLNLCRGVSRDGTICGSDLI